MIEPGDWGMNPRQPGRADLRFSRLGRRGFRAEIKLHRRRLLRPGRGLEIGLVLETKRAGEKDRRDALDGGIIVARGVVESSAFDGDAVLRAFELRLEHLETGAGLEVGVAFDDDQQSGKRGAELALRLLELREL